MKGSPVRVRPSALLKSPAKAGFSCPRSGGRWRVDATGHQGHHAGPTRPPWTALPCGIPAPAHRSSRDPGRRRSPRPPGLAPGWSDEVFERRLVVAVSRPGDDLRPQLGIRTCGRAARMVDHQRHARDAHQLDCAGHRDHSASDAWKRLRERLRQLTVQPPPAVDHRQERHDAWRRLRSAREERLQLLERAHRQRGGHKRHEQQVGGREHVLGHERDRRRAVEDRDVVVLGERVEHAGDALQRLLALVERDVQVSIGEVGG